ncbi:MAG: hypothetical protein ACTSSP_08445, partial [Candidatus Asgardarchaeia archaeon]
SVHIINKEGIPIISISSGNEPIDPEVMSAIITTLKALAETSKVSGGELDSFTIGNTQFYAIDIKNKELTIVISVEKPTKSDFSKIDQIKNVVVIENDMSKIKDKINEILYKESLLDKTRKWADEVWG